MLIALLIMASAVSAAASISVGGVSIAIVRPDGFSPVTPEMASLYELQNNFVAPMNQEFVAFIRERDVASALADEIPDMTRRFTVQTAKSLIDAKVSASDFAQLKDIIRSENDKLMTRVEEQLPGLLRQLNEGLTRKYDVDLALSVSQMLPMPIHEESERTLAYSALVRYDMNDKEGGPAQFVAVVTSTFVHVRGKVLFLYSYAEESGLDWSRQASRHWASAVVEANPSDFQASISEAMPSAISRFDWEKVGVHAVAGAFIALIISLIGWVIGRGKKG